MAHEIVGFLKEQGYEDADIAEMVSPMELEENPTITRELGTLGTPLQRYDRGGAIFDDPETVMRIMAVAERDAQRPGPQRILPPGKGQRGAKAVRVDTEKSFKDFSEATKATSKGAGPDLDALAAREQRILMGEDLGDDDDESDGFYRRDDGFYRRDDGAGYARLGDGFYRRDDGAGYARLGDAQHCVLCGSSSPGTAVCGGCSSRLSGVIVGFGERGAASDIYTDDALDAGTAAQLEVLGDVQALETPWPAYDQARGVIPLSFSQPDAMTNITAWQSGPDIYSSVRLTGWDGQPRILTATTKFDRAVNEVVGYAKLAGIAPASLVGVVGPLACRRGAGSLVPRICAASPALLGAARYANAGPFIAVVGRR